MQVKAEKHSARAGFDDDGYCSSPGTPGFNEETAFSLVCSTAPLFVCCYSEIDMAWHDWNVDKLFAKLDVIELSPMFTSKENVVSHAA